ncbi:MAG: hypothetical protein SH848_05215 [Saprospiraceae bacterium]|mgnify:CR=1 FL=1|nr:hypothetical protein [Saprospiraceae bacterium]MDZ4703305.1 hypothetical protein [Saprospiraceae bacterium]
MKDAEKYTNPDLTQQELDELTGKLLRAKFNRDKKQKWAKILDKEHHVQRGSIGKLRVASRNPLRTWLLVAASLLLPVLLFFWLWGPSTPSASQLADTYLQEEKILEPQTRKGDISLETLAQKATEAYNGGKFQEAIGLWKQMEAKGGMSPDDYFFKAVSQLRLKQYENAIANFLRIRSMEAENQKFQKEMTWMLALTYLKAGRPEAAKAELQQVVQDGWRAGKAKKLLELLPEDQ